MRKGTRKISVVFNQGGGGGSRGSTLGLRGDRSQRSEIERVMTAAKERALLLCLDLLVRPNLCLLTSAPQGENKKFKHSTAIRVFFQTTYFLMSSAASSSVFFNVIGVCGYKIPHHEPFNAR